jgi:SAM-dependent methyltransferase
VVTDDFAASPEPKPAHLQPKYGAQFQDSSVVAAYHHRPPYPVAVIKQLAALIAGSPRVVLDAGCGSGDIARPLAPFVDRVDAVDISAGMVDQGRLRPGGADPRIRWTVAAMEDAELDPP